MGKRILIVDDDASLANVLSLAFRKNGYEPFVAVDGHAALRSAYQNHPDVVIMDVMLPQMDGWEACRRLKTVTDVPVLMVTCRTEEADVLKSFRAGADDYMRKPFSLGEMNARVQALLRRSDMARREPRSTVLRIRDLVLDVAAHRLTQGDRAVDLTPTEFRLLCYMMQNAGRVLPHDELLAHVWGPEYRGEKSYLMYYVRFLRKKLRDDTSDPRYIITIRGRGYRFVSDLGAAQAARQVASAGRAAP
jgi:two-component system KDP operon response regulator KdpE